MSVGWFVCVSPLIMCAIITSCKLLPCNFTVVNLTTALSTGVAVMSSLAQLRVREQWQHTWEDMRLTESRNARSEQLLVMTTEQLTV